VTHLRSKQQKPDIGDHDGDRVTMGEPAPETERSLELLSVVLLAETCQPDRVRRACLPKPNGAGDP
jgi:hypothetical protein